MANTINYGIDLGTTNSSIAKYFKGEVSVYKSPINWMDTTPSVVAYRKGSIHIGEKAKEYAEKDPQNVFSRFKRKMGTGETFKIESISRSVTPVELSAHILKHLKSFVSDASVEAAVITIPASFDTVQSNATKEAGYEAGFKQVELLLEPIAASLAYANDQKGRQLKDGCWVVYDLGGGTFDVALLKILNGEMKVVDNVGDNYLGGSDFDQLIVEKIIVPKLESAGQFKSLLRDLQSASGKYNDKYYHMLHVAEKAKIALSSFSSAEMEIEIVDESGKQLDELINITRSEFEALITAQIDRTVNMIKELLVKNNMIPKDIQFVLMVGGSTYIPLVRKRTEELLQIDTECGIDPTTAIVKGAAHYAGTRPLNLNETKALRPGTTTVAVKMAYPKTSQDKEEFIGIRISGDYKGCLYRITREDGGFDTGLVPAIDKIQVELPLADNTFNLFHFVLVDSKGNQVQTDATPIGIAHGKYSISGQPLPDDICLEADSADDGTTKLQQIFSKNDLLPLRNKIKKILNKNIVRNSSEMIVVNVYEGPHDSIPEANKLIGRLEISGKELKGDVYSGSELEIELTISESRDLAISAYVKMADQEFKEIFKSKNRDTTVSKLIDEVEALAERLAAEASSAKSREDAVAEDKVRKLSERVDDLRYQLLAMPEDDTTDKKYQIEDEKRKIAQSVTDATKSKTLIEARQKYFNAKKQCAELIEKYGDDHEGGAFNAVVNDEGAFIESNSVKVIQEKAIMLEAIKMQILWRTPDFLTYVFKEHCIDQQNRMNDREAAKKLIVLGKEAMEEENWENLANIVRKLLGLLSNNVSQEIGRKIGFYG